MTECDFDDIIPGACTALLILNCFGMKECKVKEVFGDLDSITDLLTSLVADIGLIVDFKATLIDLDACVIASVTTAFLDAGCPMPSFDADSLANLIPDLSSCISLVTDLIGSLEKIMSPLGPLDDFLEVETVAGVITKITPK